MEKYRFHPELLFSVERETTFVRNFFWFNSLNLELFGKLMNQTQHQLFEDCALFSRFFSINIHSWYCNPPIFKLFNSITCVTRAEWAGHPSYSVFNGIFSMTRNIEAWISLKKFWKILIMRVFFRTWKLTSIYTRNGWGGRNEPWTASLHV